MGQKVNPIGLRLGVNRTWESRWFASKGNYAQLLHDDIRIRTMLLKRLRPAGVASVVIERPHKRCQVTIYSARPGLIIGKKGADLDALRSDVAKIAKCDVHVNIVEVRKPETDAQLIADGVAQQLERRVGFRRAMKRAVQGAIRMGAQGIRINCAGRLGGAEIARTEWYREGRVPLHTLRANIDYGVAEAHTTYGICGVKVWVFKGEIMEHDPMARDKLIQQALDTPHPPRATDAAADVKDADAPTDAKDAEAAPANGAQADAPADGAPQPEAKAEPAAEPKPAAAEAKPKDEDNPKAGDTAEAKPKPKAKGKTEDKPKAKATAKAAAKAESKPESKAKDAPSTPAKTVKTDKDTDDAAT